MSSTPDRLFAHHGYTRFWLGRICSASANQMLAVAVAWQVWDLTRSAFALGLVGLLQFVITSYSIHYTKLYDGGRRVPAPRRHGRGH